MATNRKHSETYRFNGSTYLHAGSIVPVRMEDLERLIATYESKLADPEDADDRPWTDRWLARLRRELEKKRKGRGQKQWERRPRAVKPTRNRDEPK